MDQDRSAAWESDRNSVAKEIPQVERYLAHLEQALAQQDEIIHLLTARLDPITVPFEQGATQTNEPKDVLVPLATSLRAFMEITQRNNRNLQDIIDRLQI